MSIREINLGEGLVTIIDEDDFPFASKYTWHFKPRDGEQVGYARTSVQIGGRTQHFVLHRLIIRARFDETVDHINRDSLDNRKCNLRFCTPSQNQINRLTANKQGFRGVHTRAGGFYSSICINRKHHYGPRRSTALDAARDYDEMALKLHGEFAVQNFPAQT